MAKANIFKAKNIQAGETSSKDIAPGEAITPKSQNKIIALNDNPI